MCTRNTDFNNITPAFRIEYDAYRVELEELNLGPRDTVTMPKLEQAQKAFQIQREKYQKIRDDLSVKVKLLEENKVRVPEGGIGVLDESGRVVVIHDLICLNQMMMCGEHLLFKFENTKSIREEIFYFVVVHKGA